MSKVPDTLKDSFLQFSRNGRWGTCAACPRDSNGHAYPEFCYFTERYDHQLDVDELASTYKVYTQNAPPASV